MRLFIYLLVMITTNTLLSQDYGIKSNLELFDLETNKRTVVITEHGNLEAPNWSRDGRYLIFNSQGKLYKLDISTKVKLEIPTGFADKLNNDHGLSPDGKWLAVSHHGLPEKTPDETSWPGNWLESRIYILPSQGGTPRLVTSEAPSFWHGWSPDSRTLAYVARREDNFDIYTIDTTGGSETRLTYDPGLDDGPDYSPDGAIIFYNSMRSGKMEIWSMDADGNNKTQLTEDGYSNWFPHPAPGGDVFVFLSYLEDQGEAHPAMKNVALRLYTLSDGSIRTLCKLTGGQGTINVPSWSPDGKKFAFVSYEYLKPKED